jgi:hypothetical protein
MHFTIERERLLQMLAQVRQKRQGVKKKSRTVRLYACAARVFVESHGVIAGEESLVLADGGCTLLLEQFVAILKSYRGKVNVTIQADQHSLRLFTTTLPISGYTKTVQPPAAFIVGRVTDVWVAGGSAEGSGRHLGP